MTYEVLLAADVADDARVRHRLSFAKTSAGGGIAAWYASGAQRLELEDVVPGEVKATLSRRPQCAPLLSEGGLERHGDPRGADCSKCASSRVEYPITYVVASSC